MLPPLLPEGWRIEGGATHLMAVAPNGSRFKLWSHAEHERMQREFAAIDSAEQIGAT